MPYLNLDTNFFDHPKTRRLVGLLGPMADILPIRLWAYCAKIHPVDGAMKGYSEAEIEGVIHWSSAELSPGSAVKALVKVGYLKRVGKGFACVDWEQHEGHLAAFSRRGKVAAKARWDKYATSNAQASPSIAPTNHTIHSKPSTPTATTAGDGFAEQGQQSKALIAEAAILMMPWHIKGDFQGVRIQDLPHEYCEWALKNLVKLTSDERVGCEIVIARKKLECAK